METFRFQGGNFLIIYDNCLKPFKKLNFINASGKKECGSKANLFLKELAWLRLPGRMNFRNESNGGYPTSFGRLKILIAQVFYRYQCIFIISNMEKNFQIKK